MAEIRAHFLAVLICPETRSPLMPAESSLVAELNRAIAAGLLRNRVGERLRSPLNAALVPRNLSVAYPVIDGVPCMLAEEAIDLRGHLSHPTSDERLMAEKTIFAKIADREIPTTILYEDDVCLAFRDIAPQAPVHVLIIPKKPIVSLAHLTDEDGAIVGRMLVVARDLAKEMGLDGGFRLVANTGRDGGQSVDHLHFHLLGGRPMSWPPG